MSSKDPNSRFKHWIVIILAIYILTRLLFLGFVHPWNPETEKEIILQKDAKGYHELARSLMEHHRFAYSSTEDPNTLRTPLYPIFIAGIYTLFGFEPWVVLLFQIVIGALSCLLLIFTLRRLFNKQIALIAAFFFAIDPLQIVFTVSLISDVLFVFLLVIAFYWFSRGFTSEAQGKNIVYYGLSGFFFGFSALIRPISQYIPVVVIFFFLVWYRHKLKEALKYSGAVLLMFLLAITPWLIRNYHHFGHIAISSSGSQNLLLEYAVPMVQQKRNQSMKTVQEDLLAESEQMMRADGLDPQSLNSFQKSKYYQKLAIKCIKQDPVHFMQTYFMGVVHCFAEIDSSSFTTQLGIKMPKVDIKATNNIIELVKKFISAKGTTGIVIASVILPYLMVSYLGAVVGFFVSWKRYNWGALLWCLLMASYFVFVTGVAGCARFKIPAVPFYLAFTGIGLYFLFEKIKQRRMPEKGN
ncbi:ArnT family glycosyltransferase [Acidobacteriota bacterium]